VKHSKNLKHWVFVGLTAALPLTALMVGALGCNIFSLVDRPAGDAQLISAGRACFDRGDFSCALDNYSKLSSSSTDVQVSERAFAVLDRQGASMAAFLTAFTSTGGQTGAALGSLARAMATGAGESRRLAIYDSYLTYKNITTNTQLKGLVRFVTATALASEILAEAAGADRIVSQDDIASVGATCANATAGTCGALAQCNAPASTVLVNTVHGDIDTAANRPTGSPKWDYIFYAIDNALTGMNALGAGGTFSSTSSVFNSIRLLGTPSAGPPGDNCFRFYLLSNGLGG